MYRNGNSYASAYLFVRGKNIEFLDDNLWIHENKAQNYSMFRRIEDPRKWRSSAPTISRSFKITHSTSIFENYL